MTADGRIHQPSAILCTAILSSFLLPNLSTSQKISDLIENIAQAYPILEIHILKISQAHIHAIHLTEFFYLIIQQHPDYTTKDLSMDSYIPVIITTYLTSINNLHSSSDSEFVSNTSFNKELTNSNLNAYDKASLSQDVKSLQESLSAKLDYLDKI